MRHVRVASIIRPTDPPPQPDPRRLRELAAMSEARKEMVLASIAAVVAFLEAAGGSLLGDPAKMRSVLAAFGAPPVRSATSGKTRGEGGMDIPIHGGRLGLTYID